MRKNIKTNETIEKDEIMKHVFGDLVSSREAFVVFGSVTTVNEGSTRSSTGRNESYVSIGPILGGLCFVFI